MTKRDEELTEEQLATVPLLVVPQVPKSDLSGNSIVPTQGVVRSKPVDDDDEEDVPLSEFVEEEEEEDPFLPIIQRMARLESPTVRDAMLSTGCFARLWFDSEDSSYCPEQECHLRPLCEKVYHKTIEALEGDLQVEEELEDIDPSSLNNITLDEIDEKISDDFSKVRDDRKLKRKKRRGSRKKRSCLPYLDQGENSDRLAKAMWVGLGSPPAVTGRWRWLCAETLEDRKRSARFFVNRYGSGLMVNRRSGYHSYFHNGMHLVRFWVNSKKAAWVDMNFEVSELARSVGLEVEPTTVKDKKHNFNFYPFRTKIKTAEDQQMLTSCILNSIPKMKVR